MRFDHLFDANEDETCLHVREFCASPDLSTLIQKNIPLYTLGWHSLLILMYLRLLLDMSSATKNACDYGARGVSLEIPSAAKVLNCNAGGPAITNPLPFARFLDAVWIGEAEAGFVDLMIEMAEFKKRGADRQEKLKLLSEHPSIWISPLLEKRLGLPQEKHVVRAIFQDFYKTEYAPRFPYPVLNPVHAHGSVEIMRGCPNGCRFPRGYFYRH